MLGLLLTFLGAALVSLLFPVGSGAIDRETPWIALGVAALWIGGVLMGSSAGGRAAPPPTAPPN